MVTLTFVEYKREVQDATFEMYKRYIQFHSTPLSDTVDFPDESDIREESVELVDKGNKLIIFSYPDHYVVWHIIGVTPENVNRANVRHILPTHDESFIWPQAFYQWTMAQQILFVRQTVQAWKEVGESTEVIYI